jgi:hypothetical protein
LLAFGLSVSGASAGRDGWVRAKSCILIWLDGGPSHLDTFDPKPSASEVRSQFRSIGTSVDGVQICEHLPLTAKVMRDVASSASSRTSSEITTPARAAHRPRALRPQA